MSKPISCSDDFTFFIPQGASLSYVIDELEKHECFSNLVTFKYIMIVMNKDKKIIQFAKQIIKQISNE